MSREIERGLLDTNILIHAPRLSVEVLPKSAAISAVTLAELSAGVHSVRGASADASAERARRLALLQRTEHEFEALPFDQNAARQFGALFARVSATGRSPRSRVADLMIAATAAAYGLPLFTTNIGDFEGLADVVEVIGVARPN